jgi:HK97 family phage portal protein
MGIWSRISSGFKRSKSSVEEWFNEFGFTGRTNSSIFVNQTTAMQVTTVMACVRIRSQDVAKLPPMISRVGKDGTRTDARNEPLFKLFRKPNDWQTWFEFCEMMQVGLLLRGNAYAVVIRDGRGRPLQMVPINPDRVMIYESQKGEIFYSVARAGQHDLFVLREFEIMIPAEDMFHLRGMSSNSLWGLSPIGLAREAIGLASAQEMHAANLSGNGARPSGVLQTDGKLSEDAAKRLTNSWRNLHTGVANSGKTAILEEGLKWQALTMTSVDMEFIAGRKFQVEEICRIFGVSPAKVGVMDGGAARAFEQIQLAHYTDTVHPDLVRWEQKLTAYFGLADDLDIEFDTTELMRADLAARANAARVLGVSGIATPNEGRRSFGLNPHPEGNVLLVPANMVPISQAGQNTNAGTAGPGSDQTGAPAAGGDGDPAAIPGG